jgi:formylglycine-generating enzyme required for sulfatase activity
LSAAQPPPPPQSTRRGPTIRPIDFKPGRSPASPAGRRLPRLGTVLVLLLLAALAAAAGFVFTARSVLLEVAPPPDRLALAGGFAFELGGRYLLRPGIYALSADREGFRPLRASFEVGRGAHQAFRFELERLPGLLTVAAPEGAEVSVDGESVGRTPLAALELAPGVYEVRVRAPRHREVVRRVQVEGAGKAQTLVVELEPLWALVTFRSEPAGATLRIGGDGAGRTPATVELLEGVHDFELVLAGRKPYRGRVEVRAGQPLAVPPVVLAPAAGNLVVVSEPADATVTVGGTYRGVTPLDMRLEPGRAHEVRVSKAGYGTASRQVELRPDEARELSVELDALEGEVEVVGWPPDADLFVDGEARGKARQTLRLAAVPHDIEIRKSGHAPFRTTLTPMPGVPQSLEARLETLEQAAVAATPRALRTSEGQELLRVEPGRFVMGASRREPGRRANEVLREVELTRAYYLGAREVTNAELRRFEAGHLSGQIGGRTLDLDDQPVVTVTWEDAAAYCNWLSAKEGLPPAYAVRDGKLTGVDPLSTGYRLPTEAEWAWAARFPGGQAALKYPWGETLPAAGGNYADAAARDVLPSVLADYDDRFAVTAPVAGFAPDGQGFYDLGGNVAEWVHDVYDIRPPGGEGPERDPTGPPEGEFHVIRGASWMHSTVTELRLTFRDYGDKARPDVGFRIARYLEE